MTTFKEEWTLETAMTILRHPAVDSKTWAEAVEWLLIYGPPEVRSLLEQASCHATGEGFPELQPKGYAPDGSPCYDLGDLARLLGITEEEVREQILSKEQKHGTRHGYNSDETSKLQ